MTETLSLTNHFLIAMPSLPDPNFFHSVTYICQHNEEGAMGIVITQPMDLSLGDVMEQMDLEIHDPAIANRPIYLGGPVQPERGFVIHQLPGDWDATLEISDEATFGSGTGGRPTSCSPIRPWPIFSRP